MRRTSSQPPTNDLGKLRQILRERASRTATAALARDGVVERDEVDSLRALQDLCATIESIQPKSAASRRLSAILFILALACASVLLLRVPSTAVEIDVTAAPGEFRLGQDRLLTEASVVRSVRVVGLQRLSGELCPGSTEHSSEDLLISAEPGQTRITVQPIEGKKGLTVRVDETRAQTQWKLTFSGAPVTVTSALEGALRINDQLCKSASPRAVTAVTKQRQSQLMLEFNDPPQRVLPVVLPVESLSFSRPEFLEAHGSQQTSSLLGGTIFLDDLNAKEIRLRDGEWLDIGIAGEGWLHPPTTSGSQMAWRYQGLVHTLRAGPIDGQRDLRPSWLEYARTQHALELLWGTALSFFGVAGALLRWWTPRT
jgi:hypothetical protein